jgi:hypothetical protein
MGRMPSSLFNYRKYALDLRQLHVSCPQHRRVFTSEIAAQQIMAVALLSGPELRFVGMKREGSSA